MYRQSTEALTRYRRSIVESVKPEGYDAWSERSKKELDKHPELFEAKSGESGGRPGAPLLVKRGGTTYVTLETHTPDPDKYEWDGEDDAGPSVEGTRSAEEREDDFQSISHQSFGMEDKNIEFEPEPPLDSNQYVYRIVVYLIRSSIHTIPTTLSGLCGYNLTDTLL